MESNSIKPILHYLTIIRHCQDFHSFHKKNNTTTQVLILKGKIKDTMDSSQYESRVQHKILKTIKRLKSIRKVQSDGLFHSSSRINPSKHLYITKRLPQTKSISVRDEFFISKVSTNVSAWLKPLKVLESVSFTMVRKLAVPGAKTRRLFQLMNIFRIKELNVYDRDDWGISSNILSCRFPSSLQTLTLSCPDPTVPEYGLINTLSHLNQLRKLVTMLELEDGIMLSLMNSLPELCQLTTLDLAIYGEESIKNFSPFLNKIKTNKQLKILKLTLSQENMLDVFLEAVKECPLTGFKLDMCISSQNALDSLTAFLSNSKGLKSLALFIENNCDRKALSKALLPALERIVTISTELRKFCLEITRLDTPQSFHGIFDALINRASTIKKLRVYTGPYEPSNSQFSKILRLLQNLKAPQTISLLGISIPDELLFQGIIEAACKWEDLRFLHLGTLLNIDSESLFVKLMEKILSKRGLERMSLTSSNQFIDKNLAQIDMDVVRLKNPCLEIYPGGFPIYIENRNLL